MKVRALMSVYRDNVLYRKDDVFVIPDEPMVDKVGPDGKPHKVPAAFSFKSMQVVVDDRVEPRVVRQPKPHLKRGKNPARGPLPEGQLNDDEDEL